jgi:hypothetical protein
MGYSYYLNSQRAADDPKKLDIHTGVALLTPIVWPMLLVGAISLLILKVLIYGIFLVLFTIALLIIRQPFLMDSLKKAAAWIGDQLLQANSFLLRIVFGNFSKNTQST